MICQYCGKCILPNDMFIVKFEGKFLPIKATWITCNPCAADLTREIVGAFSPETLKAVDICAYRRKAKKNG